MALKLLGFEPEVDNLRQFKIFDDFLELGTDATVTSGLWLFTNNSTSNGTIDADGVGGIVNLLTAASDNSDTVMESIAECFKVATDKPMAFLMRAKVNSVTADQAGFLFGFMDAVGGDSITDGDAVAASKHQITMRHPDGGTTLEVSSTSTASGTYNNNVTDAIITDNTWYSYMFLVEPLSTDDKRITYYFDSEGGVNFQKLKDSATGTVIQHTWSLADTAAGTGEMALMATLKAGAGEAQEMAIDYIGGFQLR